MKTAISIPDEVFAEAERLAARSAKSRSQLYTDAVREYLARHDPDTLTERLDEIVDELGAAGGDRFVAETARHLLQRVEW